ncbi:hypothetical protein T09_1823 [Trichinella sp. T9]|nr:hypothetical protein T09_1823 [Trichinella sp. T9]
MLYDIAAAKNKILREIAISINCSLVNFENIFLKHEERTSLLTFLKIRQGFLKFASRINPTKLCSDINILNIIALPELMEFSESHDTIETVTILQFVLHDKSNEKFANHFYDKIPVAKTSYD